MSIIVAYASCADLPYPAILYPTSSSTSTASPADVKEGINLLGSSGANQSPWPLPLGSKPAEIWASMYIYRRNSAAGTYSIMRFHDSVYSKTQPLFAVGQIGVTGEFRLLMWNGTAMVAVSTESFAIPVNTLLRMDVRIKIADTGGAAQLYMDGALVVTGTVDDTKLTAGITGIDYMEIEGPLPGVNSATVYSAIIIADEDTRAMKMIQMLPTGNSTVNTAWSGTYTAVDEAGWDDTDANVASATGQNKGYTHGALPSIYATGHEVKAVILSGRMSKGNTALDIKTLFRIGSTNYIGPSFGAELQARGKQVILPLSPATGIPWTYTEAASEFGVACV